MKIFGRAMKTTPTRGILEMKEITIQTDPERLRAIAEFLTRAADELERSPGKFDHVHLRGTSKPDIIVANPGR